MRIGIVGPVHPHTGGIAQHTTRLALELQKRGHQIHVESWRAQYPSWLYRGTPKVPNDRPEIGVPDELVSHLAWFSPRSWWKAGERLRHSNGVIFSIPTPWHVLPYWLISLAMGKGPKRVGVVHNVLPHEAAVWDETLMSKMANLLDSVVVHGETAKVRMAEITKKPTEIVSVSLPSPWPNPTDSPFREARKVTPRPIKLLFFGTVRRYKGLDLLLEAIARVDGVTLVVAGDFWEPLGRYQSLAESLGITHRVRFEPGYVAESEFERVFGAADILVLPYRSGSGSIVRELGFRFGLPVVATNVGSIAESIVNGKNGIIVDKPSVPALAGALEALVVPDTLNRFRAGVRGLANNQERLWNQYCAAIELTMEAPPRRD